MKDEICIIWQRHFPFTRVIIYFMKLGFGCNLNFHLFCKFLQKLMILISHEMHLCDYCEESEQKLE